MIDTSARVLALAVIAQAVEDLDLGWLTGASNKRNLLMWLDLASLTFEDIQERCVRGRDWLAMRVERIDRHRRVRLSRARGRLLRTLTAIITARQGGDVRKPGERAANYWRSIRERRKALGVCAACGQRPPKPGYVTCSYCIRQINRNHGRTLNGAM